MGSKPRRTKSIFAKRNNIISIALNEAISFSGITGEIPHFNTKPLYAS